jgi:DNA-binding CsgD family transcriptional regulator
MTIRWSAPASAPCCIRDHAVDARRAGNGQARRERGRGGLPGQGRDRHRTGLRDPQRHGHGQLHQRRHRQAALLEAPEAADDLLTPRQIQILQSLARGKTSKQIAFELGLSPKTVDVHRSRIIERLGLRDVASLTMYAVRKGLVKP